VPRRQRPRAKPLATRKKARRRPLLAPVSPSEASGSARPRVVPFPSRSRAAAEITAAPPRVGTYEYGYVLRELRRIVTIGGAALLLVVVLSLILR
jgi:hypothetical protein